MFIFRFLLCGMHKTAPLVQSRAATKARGARLSPRVDVGWANGWTPVPNSSLHLGLSFPHNARLTCMIAPVLLHFNCFVVL